MKNGRLLWETLYIPDSGLLRFPSLSVCVQWTSSFAFLIKLALKKFLPFGVTIFCRRNDKTSTVFRPQFQSSMPALIAGAAFGGLLRREPQHHAQANKLQRWQILMIIVTATDNRDSQKKTEYANNADAHA